MPYRYFAREIIKIATTDVPPIPRYRFGITSRSGTSARVKKTVEPRVKAPKTLPSGLSKIPSASGKTKGTNFSKTQNTVPNPTGGETLVR
jgi:hypothetical protein